MTYPAPDKIPYDSWFDDKPHPHDSIPVATNGKSFDWEDTAPSEYEPPDPEEEDITLHEKMYRIAMSRYNPFSVGGSENCHSDLECNIGGSEEISKKPPEPEIRATDFLP